MARKKMTRKRKFRGKTRRRRKPLRTRSRVNRSRKMRGGVDPVAADKEAASSTINGRQRNEPPRRPRRWHYTDGLPQGTEEAVEPPPPWVAARWSVTKGSEMEALLSKEAAASKNATWKTNRRRAAAAAAAAKNNKKKPGKS